jgi:hypothetical protein
MLHPPEYPLQGFGGKAFKPVEKVSLPVSFRDLDNARTETLTFDVVDIYHPYLAIFGRGFMNKFDAVIRQQFLCMKMPAPKGVITVFSDQQEARNIEKGHTPGQVNVYQLKTTEETKEPYEEAKRDKEKIEIAADGKPRKYTWTICLMSSHNWGSSQPRRRDKTYTILEHQQGCLCLVSQGFARC